MPELSLNTASDATYLSFEDEGVDHAKYHIEPDAVQDVESTQQTVVRVIDVGHSNDHVTFEQCAAQDPATPPHNRRMSSSVYTCLECTTIWH